MSDWLGELDVLERESKVDFAKISTEGDFPPADYWHLGVEEAVYGFHTPYTTNLTESRLVAYLRRYARELIDGMKNGIECIYTETEGGIEIRAWHGDDEHRPIFKHRCDPGEVGRLLALLRRVEWSAEADSCPLCGYGGPHAANCALSAALNPAHQTTNTGVKT